MFRTAELGRKISKEEFDAIAPALRIELLEVQQRLRNCDFPVIILFHGVDGAGKNQTINVLSEWMDPRWIVTRAYGPPSDEERERPEYWRYWRDLPPKGRIGLFLRSWYSSPVLDTVYERIQTIEFERKLDRILAFEKALADDGALILKFWMHLSQKAQKRRLKSLEKDPHESWRVTPQDWENWRNYDRFIATAERTIIRTSQGHAPWAIVEGEDARYRTITVLTAFRDAALRHIELRHLRRRTAEHLRVIDNGGSFAAGGGSFAAGQDGYLTGHRVADPQGDAVTGEPPALTRPPPQPSILHALDMERDIAKEDYERDGVRLRARLNGLHRAAKERGISCVLVFEGWDAAGKGGTIRRITSAMDARDYLVHPMAAPTDEERVHHYLWRFWRLQSRAGRVTIFDRSWYGRVLVERVEGFATSEEWRRAYAEINDFEQQLVEHGIVLIKYWMHITKDEQLKRFKRREEIAYKRWKLTEEDWRNRHQWEEYEAAVNDMIEKTSTRIAPWTLIEANSKRYARLRVVEHFCERLEGALAEGAVTKVKNGAKQVA